ncbi:(2Fe-2S)-binding protein [Nonomuraea sp. NPDC050310]|uniref:(2Fe-2S)-binding protein n=1 Tax=Nonomuraea sp. NPDC050310 TaxID=3154935 RepID=UPI0033F16DBE
MKAMRGFDETLAELAGYGERFRLTVEPDPDGSWIPADRLLDPASPELAAVLEAERMASGQVSAHATALTVMAVYASTVTTSALLSWALFDEFPDLGPGNVLIRLGAEHGFDAVAVREARLGRGLDLVVRQVLGEHLEPLAGSMRAATKAGMRQLRGGAAFGCAMAFCAASRRPDADVDLLEAAYKRFLAAAPADFDRLGQVVRLAEGDRSGLFYLRNTCCLYYTAEDGGKCASCCLDSPADRIAVYRRALTPG